MKDDERSLMPGSVAQPNDRFCGAAHLNIFHLHFSFLISHLEYPPHFSFRKYLSFLISIFTGGIVSYLMADALAAGGKVDVTRELR